MNADELKRPGGPFKKGGITYDVQMRVCTGYMAKSSARLVAFVGEISCSELGERILVIGSITPCRLKISART